jgi:hypothetical protein
LSSCAGSKACPKRTPSPAPHTSGSARHFRRFASLHPEDLLVLGADAHAPATRARERPAVSGNWIPRLRRLFPGTQGSALRATARLPGHPFGYAGINDVQMSQEPRHVEYRETALVNRASRAAKAIGRAGAVQVGEDRGGLSQSGHCPGHSVFDASGVDSAGCSGAARIDNIAPIGLDRQLCRNQAAHHKQEKQHDAAPCVQTQSRYNAAG